MEIVKMEIDMPDIKNAQYEFDDPDREVMDKVRRAVQFDRAGDPIKDAYRKYYSQTGRKPLRIYVGRSELIDLRSSTCAYVTCRA